MVEEVPWFHTDSVQNIAPTANRSTLTPGMVVQRFLRDTIPFTGRNHVSTFRVASRVLWSGRGMNFAAVVTTAIFLSSTANACSYYEEGICGFSSPSRTSSPWTGIAEPSFETSAVGTAYFEPGGVSFRQDWRQPMAKKVPEPKWQPKPLWTTRRLAELSAEVDSLRKKVRVAEAAVSKSPTRASFASRVPSGQSAKVVRLLQ
jgi:hypothetical protein